jgi:hypothetical protein
MKTVIAVWVGLFASALTAHSTILVGFVGVNPGDPIAGEEDLTVYNSTGPAFGCSTSNGTPVCTPVTFDNAVLTVNGTIQLHLGDIGPGLTDSSAYPSGVFIDGSIDSLSLTFSLSTTSLVSDLHDTYDVASVISLSHLAVDGSLAPIDASPALINVPEPGMFPVLLSIEILLFAAVLKGRGKRSVTPFV